jgi:protein-L-isoaspartate(D-aspartate) O-methyltransferase
MVERQIQARGICDPRVLQAMLEIPRERFVREEDRQLSCIDEPVGIGFGQTISQPYMTALMSECLRLKGGETVLDVGSGCGYHAAVLGALAARVISIEILPELAALARLNLEQTGLGGNILVVCGDGSMGYPPRAPYDAISVAAAAPDVPAALLEQLKDGGTLVIPIGSPSDQELRVIVKSQGKLQSRIATYCRFVPLVGEAGFFRQS